MLRRRHYSKVVIGVFVLLVVLATMKGALAPPPEFYGVAPQGYVLQEPANANTQSVVEQDAVRDMVEVDAETDWRKLGTVMLLSVSSLVLVGSAALIYRLKVRS